MRERPLRNDRGKAEVLHACADDFFFLKLKATDVCECVCVCDMEQKYIQSLNHNIGAAVPHLCSLLAIHSPLEPVRTRRIRHAHLVDD